MATRRPNVFGSIPRSREGIEICNLDIKSEKFIKIKTMGLLKSNVCDGTLLP